MAEDGEDVTEVWARRAAREGNAGGERELTGFHGVFCGNCRDGVLGGICCPGLEVFQIQAISVRRWAFGFERAFSMALGSDGAASVSKKSMAGTPVRRRTFSFTALMASGVFSVWGRSAAATKGVARFTKSFSEVVAMCCWLTHWHFSKSKRPGARLMPSSEKRSIREVRVKISSSDFEDQPRSAIKLATASGESLEICNRRWQLLRRVLTFWSRRY